MYCLVTVLQLVHVNQFILHSAALCVSSLSRCYSFMKVSTAAIVRAIFVYRSVCFVVILVENVSFQLPY